MSQETVPGAPEVEDLSENFLVKPSNCNNITVENNNRGIFFTINPSDYYWKNKYGKCIEADQFRDEMINEMNNLTKYYKKYKNICLDIHIHFEKADGLYGRVHSHGVILGLPESYYPYTGELIRMSQRFHKFFGKPRLKSNICADFRWTNDKWNGTYIVKQNYLKPCRIIHS